jgi:hypothetical protein
MGVVGLSSGGQLKMGSVQKPVGARKVPLEHPQQLVGLLVMLLDRALQEVVEAFPFISEGFAHNNGSAGR